MQNQAITPDKAQIMVARSCREIQDILALAVETAELINKENTELRAEISTLKAQLEAAAPKAEATKGKEKG